MDTHAVLSRFDLGTVEGINHGMRALGAALQGYVAPRFHGTGFLHATDGLTTEVGNDVGHDFPALLLASITGYRSGTELVALSSEQLSEAIRLMSPAEQCTAFQHPNIAAWRGLLERTREHSDIIPVAIFVSWDYVADSNQHVEQFINTVHAAGRRS